VGKVLAGDARQFIYVHVTSSGKDVSCTAVCEGIWPMAMTTGKPRAGSGVKAAKLGQTSAHQVTYDGHRLYYYSFSPQSPAGDGAMSFGGTWKLVTAKGALK
jgi:predicted lipoprotein with Yx(FWY)xxD motif